MSMMKSAEKTTSEDLKDIFKISIFGATMSMKRRKCQITASKISKKDRVTTNESLLLMCLNQYQMQILDCSIRQMSFNQVTPTSNATSAATWWKLQSTTTIWLRINWSSEMRIHPAGCAREIKAILKSKRSRVGSNSFLMTTRDRCLILNRIFTKAS